MKTKVYTYIFLILSSFLLLSFIRDDEGIKKLILSFQKFNTSHVQEKVYLHTDKPYYAIEIGRAHV